jgi:2-polyprenyl-6-methoxyphenol hydroxylase-like FAD-dependent oxidoreductase
MSDQQLPVIVIGAGPVGLAAAAHLLERGLEPLVLERGDEVASNVVSWSHVRVFSPWGFNIDDAARRLLERRGCQHPTRSRTRRAASYSTTTSGRWRRPRS